MQTHEKIRFLRELNQWSQEEMAEKLAMSTGGYAKIERGESSINLNRLEQIADLFHLNVLEFIQFGTQGFFFQINDNHNNNNNNTDISFFSSKNEQSEIEKLKNMLQHKDELIALKDEIIQQKTNENKLLIDMVDLLKNKEKQ